MIFFVLLSTYTVYKSKLRRIIYQLFKLMNFTIGRDHRLKYTYDDFIKIIIGNKSTSSSKVAFNSIKIFPRK